MNWDAVGAMGEIVGAIAVLSTLAYLAIQIRQSTEAQRAQTHQQSANERARNIRMHIENKDIRDALSKSQFGRPLSADEQTILFWHSILQLRTYENELYQHSMGMISDDELEVQRKLLELPAIQIETVEAIAMDSFTPRMQQEIRRLVERRKMSDITRS